MLSPPADHPSFRGHVCSNQAYSAEYMYSLAVTRGLNKAEIYASAKVLRWVGGSERERKIRLDTLASLSYSEVLFKARTLLVNMLSISGYRSKDVHHIL